MRRLVRRENASADLDLSAYVQRAQAEVGVCVAREPHGLDEGSSNESAMVTVCTVVGTVAVGCSRAGSTVVLGSLYFLSLFGPSGAATRHFIQRAQAKRRYCSAQRGQVHFFSG